MSVNARTYVKKEAEELWKGGGEEKKSEELSDTVIYLDLFDAPAQSMTIFLL